MDQQQHSTHMLMQKNRYAIILMVSLEKGGQGLLGVENSLQQGKTCLK